MDLIREVTQEYLKSDIPEFRPGDNVKVHVRLKEGEKERIQIFEGLVIARKHGGVSESFTVRKISSGIGVERTFPLHTPSIAKIEVSRRGRVRRAKLYYIRESARKGRSHQGAGPRAQVGVGTTFSTTDRRISLC